MEVEKLGQLLLLTSQLLGASFGWARRLGEKKFEVGRRESVGACAGLWAGRLPPANHVASLAEGSLPTHARDKTSPQVMGPPLLRLGPGADSLQPKAVRTSSGGGFRTSLGRNNRGTWGSGCS